MPSLHVIADDLTGACDVAAALLPWPGGIRVYPDGRDQAFAPGLAVRNTQSRTLPPAEAAGRVHAVLAGAARERDQVVLKKIDTGLRGPIGAEIDAALDAVGAARAFVLPAIPEVGRTTIGGEQRIEGVPVHRTAFANDPQNPVRDANVAAVIGSTARRAAAAVGLEAVRRAGGLRVALAQQRDPIVVLDAETDSDLARGVEALLAQPRPLVLVGSIGVARALRAAWPVPQVHTPAPACGLAPFGGVLVVAGSAHPQARRQCDRARAEGVLATVVEVSACDPESAGGLAARHLRRGASVALVAPVRVSSGAEERVSAALGSAAVSALGSLRPAGLVLVGGETAYRVVAALGCPPLDIEERPAPLAVTGRIASGPYRGLAIATKGGSSGPDDLLAVLVRRLAAGAG